MKKDRKKDKQSPLGIIAAIVIIFLVEAADSAEGLAALIVIAVIAGAAVLLVRKLRPKAAAAAARESAEQPHSEGRHISFVPEIHLHSDGSECVNTLRGREKYYAQLDSFLKNGIIDRDEYRFMRERYARMDIPDDL